jgi:glutathione S-transferase
MIELIQFPCSPFCIVQRRILEFSGARFKVRDIPYGDRGLIWKLTKQRYYQVPIIRDSSNVVFETSDNSQVIAKYIDEKLHLGLFPHRWEGVQDLLWRYFENEVEGLGFKLNDIYYEEFVPAKDRLLFLRHKERKFGRECLEKWREEQHWLLSELKERLQSCEQMLATREFLLDSRPLFVDFDLFGMLGNFLFSGHYQLPAAHVNLAAWHKRMAAIKFSDLPSEKLHS